MISLPHTVKVLFWSMITPGFITDDPGTRWIKTVYTLYEKRCRYTGLSASVVPGTLFTMEAGGHGFLNIHEANLTNYAGIALVHDEEQAIELKPVTQIN